MSANEDYMALRAKELCETEYLAACWRGDMAVVKNMLDQGVPIDTRHAAYYQHRQGNGTALHCAVIQGHFELAEMLLERGMDLHIVDGEGRNVGLAAANSKSESAHHALKWLLDKFGSIFKNENNWDLLHDACESGTLASVDLLLECGFDPNAKSASGWTPLHGACGRDVPSFMRTLLKAGAAHDVMNRNGYMPIHCMKHTDLVLEAHAIGWDLDVRGPRGMTLMQLMDKDKRTDMLRVLMAIGADNSGCYGITQATENIIDSSPLANAIDTKDPKVLMAHLEMFGLPGDDLAKEVRTKLTKNPEMKSVIDALKAKNRMMSIAQGARSSLAP